MLKIASKRLNKYKNRIHFTQADLIGENWIEKLNKTPYIVISTWALHDLFDRNNILNVSKSVFKILPKGGLLLNGDFIKPEESNYEYEGGRIKPSEHIQLLGLAKFRLIECIKEFEKDILNPTTANNYACFGAEK